MQILFVASESKRGVVSPIVFNQSEAIKCLNVSIDIFTLKSGVVNYFLGIFILRKNLISKDYDLIHAHYGLCGLVSLIARKREKIIVSFMGDDIIGSRKLDGSIFLISKLFAILNRFLARLFYDFVIVKSQEMLVKLGNNTKASVIPNGVDLKVFQSKTKKESLEKIGWNPEMKHIIFVSNPKRLEKNYSLAKKAHGLTNNSSIQLHIIYDIPNNKLFDYYNAADTLLMTSFHEGSPNVIKEAMACNCPAVCTDVGDVKKLFGKIEGYFLVSKDPQDIADKLIQAIEFREHYRFSKGRNRITELGLDSKVVAKKILNTYNNLLIR